jgi:hypothetical protein
MSRIIGTATIVERKSDNERWKRNIQPINGFYHKKERRRGGVHIGHEN